MKKYMNRHSLLCGILFCFVLLNQHSAKAEPTKLWTFAVQGEDAYATNLQLLPKHGIALAAITNQGRSNIVVLDIKTGTVKETFSPKLQTGYQRVYLDSIVSNDRYIAVLTDDGGGGDVRQFFILVYDAATRKLLWQLNMPADQKDHSPTSGSSKMHIDGDHLVLDAAIRGSYKDTNPILMHFNLSEGKFVRSLGLIDMDATAKKGWFGSVPKTPDFFFSNIVLADGKVFIKPQEGLPKAKTVLSYDLVKGEIGSTFQAVDVKSDFLSLQKIESDALYYISSQSFKTANIIEVNSAIRVDRHSNKIVTVFADPFSPKQKSLSLSAFIADHVKSGVKPYIASWFPESISISEKYLVASAPNAPVGSEKSAGALVIFDAKNGEPNTMLLPSKPGAELYYGRSFAHKESLVLVSTQNNYLALSRAPQTLELHRLD